MFPKKIYLVRHGSTGSDNQGRLVGATDIPVCDAGLASILRFKTLFDGLTPEALYASPMVRTRQTMAALKEHCGWSNDVFFDDRLREMDFGYWEMKTWPDIMQKNREMMNDLANYDGFVFPGGEEVNSFVSRVAEMLFLFKNSDEQELIVVSHGGVIRTCICLALGLPARHYLLFNIKPASLTVLELYDEGGTLCGMNL